MRRRKQVQFNDVVCVGRATSWMSEERDYIWYQDTEIDSFKKEAMCLSFLLDTNIVIAPATDDNIECTRGLEQLRSIQRIQNMIVTKRIIFKALKRFQDPNHVARVADKCTEWSRKIALITAEHDHDNVTVEVSKSIQELPSCELFGANAHFGKKHIVPKMASPRTIKRHKVSHGCLR